MGSSAKKKKEKKKDFQKTKLKVGKAKLKPSNATDTSFKSKAIVLNQQSLSTTAPSEKQQFLHHVSLLSSRADQQRKESLAYLTSFVIRHPENVSLPITTGGLLDKTCPLILDGNSSVREQLQKLFLALSARNNEVGQDVTKTLPYLRAGLTHLSTDVRKSSLELFSTLLDVAGEELVSAPGGWNKSLETFVMLLGWQKAVPSASSSSSSLFPSSATVLGVQTSVGGRALFSNDAKFTARMIQVLDQLVTSGLYQTGDDMNWFEDEIRCFPLHHLTHHQMPTRSNPYAGLNLFGELDGGKELCHDPEKRMRVFDERFRSVILSSLDPAKREGGEVGRAAGNLAKTMDKYSRNSKTESSKSLLGRETFIESLIRNRAEGKAARL